MIETPLPRSSGIGRAARWELCNEPVRQQEPAIGVATRPKHDGFFYGGLAVLGQPAARRFGVLKTSNATPTLATKPIPWANLLRLLSSGVSVKMEATESVLTAAFCCALWRQEG